MIRPASRGPKEIGAPRKKKLNATRDDVGPAREGPRSGGRRSAEDAKHDERTDQGHGRGRGEDTYGAVDGRHVLRRSVAKPIVPALLERHAERSRHPRHRLPGVRAPG